MATNVSTTQQWFSIDDALNNNIIESCAGVDKMDSHPIIMQYYALQNAPLVMSQDTKKVYVQAKQIIMFYDKPFNNNYQTYVDWMFKKLMIVNKPTDPMYPLMERYLNGEMIPFETFFNTMTIDEMSYLGD